MVTIGNRPTPDFRGRTGCVITQWEQTNHHGRPIERVRSARPMIGYYVVLLLLALVLGYVLGKD